MPGLALAAPLVVFAVLPEANRPSGAGDEQGNRGEKTRDTQGRVCSEQRVQRGERSDPGKEVARGAKPVSLTGAHVGRYGRQVPHMAACPVSPMKRHEGCAPL
jgi:hypothetical protein